MLDFIDQSTNRVNVSMIKASGLTRTYGSNIAVDGLSFTVPRGEVCGFLGPNGAGKSSTIRMIAGLAPPDAGTLSVGGIDAVVDPVGVRRQVGYLPESNALYPELRVEEYLAFKGRLSGLSGLDLREGIDRALGSCGLLDARRRLIGNLSRGFRQRTGLAAALVADPPLLVLDEPTVGLDPVQQVAFRTLLQRLSGDRTVLLSSHLLAEVESTCTWLLMISGGRLVAAGSKDEVLGGGSQRIQAEISSEHASTLLSACREEPGFSGATLGEELGTSRTLVVVPAPGTPAPQALLGEIAARLGIPLRALGTERPTLESIFLDGSGQGAAWNPEDGRTPRDEPGGD